MIVLDTNVVSETLKKAPDASVLSWLNEQVAETLYLSSVTVAELWFGIAALPSGKKKQALTTAVDQVIALFEDRVLAFDMDAARSYAELATLARRKGRGFPTPDGYIAAIAASHGFVVASRDTAPFAAAGMSVVNPWTGSGSVIK